MKMLQVPLTDEQHKATKLAAVEADMDMSKYVRSLLPGSPEVPKVAKTAVKSPAAQAFNGELPEVDGFGETLEQSMRVNMKPKGQAPKKAKCGHAEIRGGMCAVPKCKNSVYAK